MQSGTRDPMTCETGELLELAEDTGRCASELWPPLLNELVDVLESYFRRTRCSTDSRSDAEAIIAVIAEHFGGRQIYLPRGDRLRRALRNVRIRAEFDGRNVPDLARRYHMSEMQIRAILKRGRP